MVVIISPYKKLILDDLSTESNFLHILGQKKIGPIYLLPHIIDKATLQTFAQQQLQLAKSVLNSIG